METKDNEKEKQKSRAPRTALISLLVLIIFMCVILTTDAVAKNSGLSFIGKHEKTIVNTELAIFALILVEFIGKAIIQAFKHRGIEPAGHNVRAILRGIVYLILAIGIVSSLSSNPGLAIGIGIVIAFATQNLVGNIFAGVLLAIVRPVRIGDYVSVLLSSGEVKEIALMYTILEDGDNWYYVPSMVMFSNVIKRKKAPTDKLR
jgi:small-conductance mechanosensitive channel